MANSLDDLAADVSANIASNTESKNDESIAGSQFSPEQFMQYSSDNLNFTPDKYVPYSDWIEKAYGKLANIPVGEKRFSETALGGPVTGLAEGLGSVGSSIANLPLGWMGKYTQRPDLSQFIDLGGEGLGSQINKYGYIGGNIVGQILPEVLAYEATGGLTGGLTGVPGTLARAGSAGSIGYAFGEHAPGGRGFNALLSAMLSPAYESSTKRLGKKITEAGERTAAKYGPPISEAASKAAHVSVPFGAPGITEVISGKVGDVTLRNSGKARKALVEFFNNPTGENAQKALSKLKEGQRNITKGVKNINKLPHNATTEYDTLQNAITSVQGKLIETLGPEQASYYTGALEKYRHHAAPYEVSKTGKGPEYIVKDIRKMAEKGGDVRKQYEYLAKQHPELKLNKYMDYLWPIMKNMLTLGAGVGYGNRQYQSTQGND